MSAGLSAKPMQLLKDTFPSVTRATIVWNPERPDNTAEVNAMLAAAEQPGMKIEARPVRSVGEVTTTLPAIPAGPNQALLNVGDPMIGGQ